MKRFVKFFVPVAVAAIALVSCAKEAKNSVEAETIDITVRPIVEAFANDATIKPSSKTYIDNTQTILWGTGEYMKIAVTAGETTTFANSSDNSANSFNGQSTAEFEFSFSPEDAASYTYMGLYPASAASTSSNTNATNYKVNLPAIQNATASSYDPAAYIMVAKPVTSNEKLTEWTATFRRATALNKITLKNVPSGVSFNKVKITAEGKKLAGGRHFNLTAAGEDQGLEVYGTDAAIEVLYTTPVSGTNVDVWFTSWNAEIAEGEKLTIVAYTTDNKSYTKQITARAEGIKFQEGYLNTLGANLEGISPENVASLDGNYVILAENSGHYYALKGEASGTRIASVDYTGSTSSYAGDASIIWTIATSGSGYTIKNGSNFIGWTSGNAADLVDEANYDATQCLMDIDDNGDGTYKIYVAADVTRILARNQSNAYFAFYTGSGYNALVLVPATTLEQVATPTFSPAAGEVTSGDQVTISCATSGATIHYTVDGTDPTSSSASYSSPITITATTTIKAIAVKEGMADSEIATATYSVASAGSVTLTASDITAGENTVEGTNNSVLAYRLGTSSNNGSLTFPAGYSSITFTLAGWASGTRSFSITNGTISGETSLSPDAGSPSGTINAGFSASYAGTEYTIVVTDPDEEVVFSGRRCVVWGFTAVPAGPAVTWNLESIAITTEPSTTVYTAGQSFDPAGMVVTGHFVDAEDNTNTKDEAVTGYTISPDGALATTDDHVTITYQGKTTTQSITVNAAPVVTYDFETIAELNALAENDLSHDETGTYSGKLTDAIISYVPNTGNAIIKDASGSILVYKTNHGYQQGQTFSGDLEVTVKMYYTTIEITAIDASFSGSQAEVLPATMTIAQLEGNFSTYQNAFVKLENLTVDSRNDKTITVSNGGKTYVVYDNAGSSSAAVGDVITAVGTVADHSGTNQIKVWSSDNITITTVVPRAITFSQPSAGGSFTVSTGGSNISSGTTVAAGTTVTLAATPASGYNFSGWNVTGASVVDANDASTSFEMGSSPVSISATFTQSGSTTHYYVKVTSTTSITNGDYLIVYESGNVAFNGGLNSFDAVGNTIGVNITSNGIEATSTVNAAKFTINSMTGGYSIMGASGKYITVGSYANGLSTSANAAANGIAFDSNGNALITVSFEGGTMTLKYNSASNQTRFRYYKSGQQNIQLYRLN